MKRTKVPWSKLLESARAKTARAQEVEPLREADFGAPPCPEALRHAREDALRSAYESLEGGFVLDLDEG
ncbi:MAG: hypothetical protein D6731_25695 [Planctomycetota bacterium]|nr:MAG: hypothetical protein D6731_25695 [Planctomycetota bacterium]